jgi:fructokinase
MKYDVVALGELLIDFTENGVSQQGNSLFEANPGGAPCNVLAMLSKLNYKTSFIGKVGNDLFGKRLKNVLEELNIGTDNLILDDSFNTTLAFVHKKEDGDRDFSFYRKLGADIMLMRDEVQESIIKKTKIFHFGTLSMTSDPACLATERALEIAKENDVLISFDPNLRINLWDTAIHAKERIRFGLSKCDILKISEDELEFITGCTNIEQGVAQLKTEYDISLIAVTMGKMGSIAYYKDCSVKSAPYENESIVDTTGAGDTFCACLLHGILTYGLDQINAKTLEEILSFANAAASLVTLKKGALYVMPSKEEIMCRKSGAL